MIAAIEDQIVARLGTAFQGRLKEVDHKPARLTDEELNRILTVAPAAYVAFLGWTRKDAPDFSALGTFGVYLIAAHAGGEIARRRGDDATIGAYEMIEIAAAQLEDWTPADGGGPIEVRACENLFGAAFERAGRTVYGLTLDVPMQVPDPAQVTDQLDDFLVLNADWDVPPHGNVARPPPAPPTGPTRADATDRVELPAP